MAISTHESNQGTLGIYLVSLKYIDLVMHGVWDNSAHPHPFQSMVVSSLIYSTQVSTSITCAFISNTYASTSTTDASIYNFYGISCSSISLLCYGLNLCTWSSYCTPKRYTVYSQTSLHLVTLSYHLLQTSHIACFSSSSFASIPKIGGKSLSHLEWPQVKVEVIWALQSSGTCDLVALQSST